MVRSLVTMASLVVAKHPDHEIRQSTLWVSGRVLRNTKVTMGNLFDSIRKNQTQLYGFPMTSADEEDWLSL